MCSVMHQCFFINICRATSHKTETASHRPRNRGNGDAYPSKIKSEEVAPLQPRYGKT